MRIETGHAAAGCFADHQLLSYREPVQATIADLAVALVGGAAVEEVLRKLTLAALVLVPSADCAKISVRDDSVLFSLAATSQLTASLDSAQQAAGHGPCLEAISARKTIRCDDLTIDARWPRFAPRATAAGVHSALSCPLHMAGDTCATLSLFGARAEAFGVEAETVGAMLANHAAIALVHDKRERQLRAALATRDVIGQAKGIVMERFGVDATRAFAMLVTISQDTNTPVRDLAARLVGCATP